MLACAATALLMLFSAVEFAGAATATVGRQDLSVISGTDTCSGPCVWGGYFNASLAAPGSTPTVPADGTISGWRVRGNTTGFGRIKLHAIRPGAGETYLGVGDAAAATDTTGTGLNATALPVLAGDQISITLESGAAGSQASLGQVVSAAGVCGYMNILLVGSTATSPTTSTGCEYLYNAQVDLLAPRVDSINLKSGPVAGGSRVTITGDHLAIATSVMFGTHAAVTTAASDKSITATSPPGSGLAPISVSTAGGTSPVNAAATFTYDDARKPAITKFKFAHAKFLTANIGGPVIASRVGSRVSFKLSEAASLTLSVSKVGAKGKLKALAKKRGFSFHGAAGANKFTFTGRPGKKSLTPGKYVLIATPKDLLGNKGKPVRAAFTVVK
jgi:hypothetical protein